MGQNMHNNIKTIILLLKGFLFMKKIVCFFAFFCAGVANAGVISATQGYSVSQLMVEVTLSQLLIDTQVIRAA